MSHGFVSSAGPSRRAADGSTQGFRAEIGQGLAIQEKGRCGPHAHCLQSHILIQDDCRIGVKPVRPGLFQIQTHGTGDTLCTVEIRRSMDCPFRLLFEQRIQHRLELFLSTRRFENAHRLVRAFVERRIAQHDP